MAKPSSQKSKTPAYPPGTAPHERALRLLELPKVLSRLEELCACELGREQVHTLRPSSHLETVARRQAFTSEARRYLHAGKATPFGGISDVRPFLQRAQIGAMLEARELNAIKRLAEGARRLKSAITSAQNDFEGAGFPLLNELAESIEPRQDIEKAINDAVDEATEEIKDDASLDLLRARRNMRQVQNSIQSRLRSMLSDPNIQPALQDAFVTVRDGRYCLPVKSEARSRVPGIVHDRSSSGAAVFVEPQAVVEMNNQLRELLAAEREAIIEILRLLSARVAGAVEDLRADVEVCAELDFVFAKGRLSLALDATEPKLVPDNEVPKYFLTQARHPLIEGCVPNDIRLGDDIDVVLITGPNTGGKTVVLKTLGLLSLMTMCGLHIPAKPGSGLRMPGAIFADIGDEQSIEQSLSTFSSHMKNIIAILGAAEAGDLVLFDEIGAGTDPDEGAALAQSVLRNLQRRGVQVMATTHYGELKQFASSAMSFENASVEFDSKSLRPTYHLRIGIPGQSNAFDIAARLGMPPDLVARARRYVGRDRELAEAATRNLEETQRELTEQTSAVQRERDEATRIREEYERKLARLQAKMEDERERAREEADRIVRKAQREADEVLRDLRSVVKETGREGKETEAVRGRLRTLQEKVQSSGREGRGKGNPPQRPPEVQQTVISSRNSNPEPRTLPKSGDIVRVKSLGREAVLLEEINGRERVAVRVGAMRLQVPARDLEAVTPKATGGGAVAVQLNKTLNVVEEVNVIGQTTDEALLRLEKYLDDAVLSGVNEVRIIHGRGSGALRSFIQRWLRDHPNVASFATAPQNMGGEGATIVKLG